MSQMNDISIPDLPLRLLIREVSTETLQACLAMNFAAYGYSRLTDRIKDELKFRETPTPGETILVQGHRG